MRKPIEIAQFIVRVSDEIQDGFRFAAHGVHVAQGIGGRDLAEHVWIVDDRWKEVDRLDDGQFVRQLVDAGIVVGFSPDKHMSVGVLRQMAQNLSDPLRGNLAGSTRTRRVVCQTLGPIGHWLPPNLLAVSGQRSAISQTGLADC